MQDLGPAPLLPFIAMPSYHFDHLRQTRPGTVAETVPLVLWIDTVGPQNEATINCHLDFCSLYLIRQGRGTHLIDGVPYAVARGDVYVMGPGQTHWFRDADRLRTDTLHFAPDVFSEEEQAALSRVPGFSGLWVPSAPDNNDTGGRRYLHLTPTAFRQVSAQIAELRTEWERATPDAALLTRALFLRLLIHLSRCRAAAGGGGEWIAAASPAVVEGQEAVVAQAVRYLDAHFARPIRIDALARDVCLSPDRFTDVFSRAMGRTPRDYLRHLRLEHARTLLQTTDLPVSEVARQSGFGDAAYLGRILRRSGGQTASALRRQNVSV